MTDTLHVLSELGDEVTLDVTSTQGGRCAALRELWAESPLVWRDGELRAEDPPADHACRGITPAPR